jgi:TRAP-type C4-dicarboxylate transport system permease large subunit
MIILLWGDFCTGAFVVVLYPVHIMMLLNVLQTNWNLGSAPVVNVRIQLKHPPVGTFHLHLCTKVMYIITVDSVFSFWHSYIKFFLRTVLILGIIFQCKLSKKCNKILWLFYYEGIFVRGLLSWCFILFTSWCY